MKKLRLALFTVLASLVAAGASAATPPPYIPVQGMLTDTADVPIEGLVDVSFALYASPSGGAPVWQESYDATTSWQVDAQAGFFSVYLGEVQPIVVDDLASATELWLGITVQTDQEMPRIRLASVPYALFADRCGDAETLGGAAPNSYATAQHGHGWGEISGTPATLGGLSCAASQIALWNGFQWTCAAESDPVAAMGPLAWDNPLNHTRYTDMEAVLAMGNEVWTNPLNHQRYTDGEAMTALSPQINGLTSTTSDHEQRIASLESAIGGGGGTRRWAALGRHAVGRGIYRMLDYAVVMQESTSLAAWRVDLPHGATITRFAVTMAKCNDQTGNTATCRLRRHSASSFGSISTLSEFSAVGALSPCSQTFDDTGVLNPVVSDAYVYAIECYQTAAKQTSIYGVQVEYTP